MRRIGPLLLALGLLGGTAHGQGDQISHGLASDDSNLRYRAIHSLRREWSSWSPEEKAEKVGELVALAKKPKVNAWAKWTLGDLAGEGDARAAAALLEMLESAETRSQVEQCGKSILRADRETRERAVELLRDRLPKQLRTKADIQTLIEFARLGGDPLEVRGRFLKALGEAPPDLRIQVLWGIYVVWRRTEPLLRGGEAEVAASLTEVALADGGPGERSWALRGIAELGSAAATHRKRLLTLLPSAGDALTEALVEMGPAAQDTHAAVLAHWKSGPRNLTWRAVYRLAPDDARVVAEEDAVLALGPRNSHWRKAISGLAARKDPHEAFARITASMLRGGGQLWRVSHVLEVYAERPDRSEAMQQLYVEAYTSKDMMVRRTAAAALGRSPDGMKKGAREILLAALREDTTPGMTEVAAQALVKLDGAAAIPTLRQALELPRTVSAAAEALGHLGAKAKGALATLQQIADGAEIEGVDLLTARRLARQAIRRIRADDPSLD